MRYSYPKKKKTHEVVSMSATSYRRLIGVETTSCVCWTSCFIFCFTSVLISVDIIFCNIFEIHSTYLKKIFVAVFCFNGFTQLPNTHPLNGQNLLSVAKIFGEFSLRCSLKHFFFKNLLTKSCKSIFYVSVVKCNCHWLFKVFNYRFSGLLFRTYFKNSYFNTSISN